MHKTSLFPTQGTVDYWNSADGRYIYIPNINPNHFANIITMLYEAASKQIGSKADNICDTGYYTNKVIQTFLYKNCVTWNCIKNRGMNDGFLNIEGIPTEKLRNFYERGVMDSVEVSEGKINSVSKTVMNFYHQFLSIEITHDEYDFLNKGLINRIR